MTWTDKQGMYILMEIYILPVEGKFHDEHEEDKNTLLLKLQSAHEIG
jgi:hypothetical protein